MLRLQRKRRFGRVQRSLLSNTVPLDLEELRMGVLAALRVYGFDEGDYEALQSERASEVKNK